MGLTLPCTFNSAAINLSLLNRSISRLTASCRLKLFNASGLINFESARNSSMPVPMVSETSFNNSGLSSAIWSCILAKVINWPILSCNSQLMFRKVSSRISICDSANSRSNAFFAFSCSCNNRFFLREKTLKSTITIITNVTGMAIAAIIMISFSSIEILLKRTNT